MMSEPFYIEVGDSAQFATTITESDIAMFCAVSGDFDPIHVDDEHARKTIFGRRVAHGILSMALLSTVSAMISRRAIERGSRGVSVSMGYDRIRFLKPVFVGDTLTARYTIASLDAAQRRSVSNVEVSNQRGELVVVGQHLMKWLPPADR
jgi:acyl dehydratase